MGAALLLGPAEAARDRATAPPNSASAVSNPGVIAASTSGARYDHVLERSPAHAVSPDALKESACRLAASSGVGVPLIQTRGYPMVTTYTKNPRTLAHERGNRRQPYGPWPHTRTYKVPSSLSARWIAPMHDKLVLPVWRSLEH